MKKSTVLDLKRFGLSEQVRKNALFLLLSIIFLIGLIVGIFACADNIVAESTVKEALRQFSQTRKDRSFFPLTVRLFLTALLPLAAMFLSGASMFGMILAPLVVGYVGFDFGIASSYLYSNFGVKGIAFHAVLMIPPAIPAILCFLSASKDAVLFSYGLSRLTLPHSPSAYLYPQFKRYCTKFLLLTLPILFSAILDALLSGAFFDSFALNL